MKTIKGENEMLNEIKAAIKAGNSYLARNPKGQAVWVTKMSMTAMGMMVLVERKDTVELYKVSDLKPF
jgi:hypothetical protein